MDSPNHVQGGGTFGQGRASYHGIGYWGANALNLAQVPPICMQASGYSIKCRSAASLILTSTHAQPLLQTVGLNGRREVVGQKQPDRTVALVLTLPCACLTTRSRRLCPSRGSMMRAGPWTACKTLRRIRRWKQKVSLAGRPRQSAELRPSLSQI